MCRRMVRGSEALLPPPLASGRHPRPPSVALIETGPQRLYIGGGSQSAAHPGNPVDRPAWWAPNGAVTLPRRVVLVEGNSDRVALRTLAQCLGRDLDAEGVQVVAMGGITNIRAFATQYGPHGLGLPLAGLYDIGEQAVLRRGLVAASLAGAAEPHELELLGFFACERDLEDELLRALGTEGVEAVIAAAGEAQSLRLLAGMPAQRGWTRLAVLRRFLGSQSGRKARYADLFVRALAPDRVPEPLSALLVHVERDPAGATDGDATGIPRG